MVISEEFVPVVQSLQSLGLGDVEHEYDAMRVLQVRWNETAIAFLSCGVPHLETVIYPVSSDVLDVEIDADCRLSLNCWYIISLIETFAGVSLDDGRFPDALVSQEHDTVFLGVSRLFGSQAHAFTIFPITIISGFRL